MNLSKCGAKSIEDQTFFNLKHLECLLLNQNDLTEIRKNAFAGADRLDTIFLNGNKIETIESGALDLPLLEEFHACANALKTIPSDLFSLATNLKLISLASNQFTEISFDLPSKLVYLDLGSNPLKQINMEPLMGLEGLKFIYFDNTTSEIEFGDGLQSNAVKLDLSEDYFPDGNALIQQLRAFPKLQYLGIHVRAFENGSNIDSMTDLFPELKTLQINNCFVQNLGADFKNDSCVLKLSQN